MFILNGIFFRVKVLFKCISTHTSIFITLYDEIWIGGWTYVLNAFGVVLLSRRLKTLLFERVLDCNI